jgi:NTP pyrophosphatase (non-canonical NTP hydrolase)
MFTRGNRMDLKELQEKIKEHGNRFKNKGDDMNSFLPNHVSFPFFKTVEELGEVSDLLVRKHGFQRKGKEISDEEFKDKLGEELIDVITTLVHLANFSDIDLSEAFSKKLTKMDKRWDNKEY